MLEDELEVLDTKLIIPGGRRTRGKKIDYKQFGADPEDEEWKTSRPVRDYQKVIVFLLFYSQ